MSSRLAIGAWLAHVDFGLWAGLGRQAAACHARGDRDGLNALAGTWLAYDVVAAALLLAGAAAATPWIAYPRPLWMMTAAVSALVLPMRHSIQMLYGLQRHDLVNTVSVIVGPLSFVGLIAFLEVLKAVDKTDARNEKLRLAIIELFHKKRDERALPYLWHLSAAPEYPPAVRAEARKTIAVLLGVSVESVPDAKAELIRLAHEKAPGLLVSASGPGGGRLEHAVAIESDFLLLHFDNVPAGEVLERVASADKVSKPIVCNQDSKTGEEGAAALEATVNALASWGYTNRERNQQHPFRFEGAADDPVVYVIFGSSWLKP